MAYIRELVETGTNLRNNVRCYEKMLLDEWDIDPDEVLDSNYEDGTICTIRDLIKFAGAGPLR